MGKASVFESRGLASHSTGLCVPTGRPKFTSLCLKLVWEVMLFPARPTFGYTISPVSLGGHPEVKHLERSIEKVHTAN